MNGRSARALVQTYLDLAGEAFIIIERDNSGRPIELWPISPTWVKSTPTKDSPVFEISENSFRNEIPEDDMIWMRHLDPCQPYGRGSGIGKSLGDEIDTDEYASKHTKAWFYNRAVPDVLIGVKGASGEQLKRAKQQWEDNHRGPQRAHSSHWHSGELDAVMLSQTFSDQQLVELREFERNTIIQVYGVPPEILGIVENSNRATIESADFIFSKYVTYPRLKFLKDELNSKLGAEDGVVFFCDNPVPADKQHILEVAKEAPYAFTVNEWRSMADHPPLPDEEGNKYFIPDAGTISEDIESPAIESESDEKTHRNQIIKTLTGAEVELVVNALDPIELERVIAPESEKLVADWGAMTMAEIEAAASFNMISQAVLEHISEASGNKIVGINMTTRDQIRRQLLQGVLEGEGSEQLARRVQSVFSAASRGRARTIARTEVLNSSNFARMEAFKQSGVVAKHKWLATLDTRVRENHLKLHNQVQTLGTDFTVDGKTAKRPGGFGRPEEDINCRCVTVPVIEKTAGVDRQKQGVQELARHHELSRRMDRWEARYVRAIKRAFKAQEKAALEEIERLSR